MSIELSPVVAGTRRMADWGWPTRQRLRWIEANLDLGITSFDLADIDGGYQVEALFGEALALAPQLRRKMQLVSKCGIRLPSPARLGNTIRHYDTSAAHVRASVEHSLRALRTDALDLLLIQRPDPLLDADELATTFDALRAEGKVRHFGASNFAPSTFAMLHRRCPLVTHQFQLSPLHREPLHDGTLDQCQDLAQRPMAWAPFASGQVFVGQDEASVRVRDCLAALAEETGETWVALLCAWVMRHPSRPHPVIGTRRIEAAHEAIGAVDLRLDAHQWYRLWQAGAGRSVA
jgi:predicted oxidoreductase